MSRRIVSRSLMDANGGKTDTHFDRVVKLIPVDVVSGWVAVLGIAKSGNLHTGPTLWFAFAFGVAFTFAWTMKQTKEDHKRPAYLQSVISTVAFAVWVFALGLPFQVPNQEAIGGIVLIGFTLMAGFFPVNADDDLPPVGN